MNLVQVDSITILQNRQRKSMEPEALMELANSIGAVGLIHPLVVRRSEDGNLVLVAGERRLRAIQTLWAMGGSFTHGGQYIHEPDVPCTNVADLPPLDAMEMELEENIRRTDLQWTERCEATSQLYELRRLQAEKRGQPTDQIADRVAGELYPDHHPKAANEAVRKELILARHLKDPDVAGAKSMDEGIKVIRRKEESARQVLLGQQVGKTFGAHSHELFLGNCLDLME